MMRYVVQTTIFIWADAQPTARILRRVDIHQTDREAEAIEIATEKNCAIHDRTTNLVWTSHGGWASRQVDLEGSIHPANQQEARRP